MPTSGELKVPEEKKTKNEDIVKEPSNPSAFNFVFLTLLSVRILNALTIRTFFQPDEYFQSLEPAWDIAFGNGWITWEWRERLRSAAHPLLFAGIYKLADFISINLALSGKTRSEVLAIAPKIFQAVFAALSDYWTFLLGKKLLKTNEGAWLSLACSVGSAFNWFCLTRTFSNSLETSLSAGAMVFWPWEEVIDFRRLYLSLSLAAIACILRPTNVLIWGLLGGFLLARASKKDHSKIVIAAAAIGTIALSANFAIDYWYYGAFTFPPLKFLTFNLVQSLSSFYGRMPWHYYLSQGLPLLLTTFLPLAIHEICNVFESTAKVFEEVAASGNPPTTPITTARFQLCLTTVFVVFTYSFIAHKEMRFLYPLVPALHVLAARSLLSFNVSVATRKKILLGLIALNVPIAWYATQVHQRGVVDVVDWLRKDKANFKSVGFLMPCHSTPWQANMQLGSDQVAWALTCEPPVNLSIQERKDYVDEADVFYNDPRSFIQANFPSPLLKYEACEKGSAATTKREWPDRLVVFEQLEGAGFYHWIGGDDSRYKVCRRFFNSQFHDDWRRVGEVVVYCLE